MSIGSNTEILIKRSLSTGVPGSLQQGELAYSYASNTIFIGTPDGLGTVNVGGQYYTSQVDSATDLANNNTLVKRDGSGNASFTTIYGALGTETGVTANTYGDQTHIPVITVAANGLITNVTTSEISTTLNIAGDSGSDVLSLITDTLTITGGEGITSTVDGSEVILDVDNTVVRSNTAGGNQTIDGIVNISGDLHVTGNITYTDVETIISQNSLIKLANNNTTSDVVDIGFFGESNNGTELTYTGLFRHAGDAGKDYYLFDNYTKEDPDASFVIDPSDPSFKVSTLHANLVASLVTSSQFLANESSDTNGGYGFVQDGAQDTGMYSADDGEIQFKSNGGTNFEITDGTFTHHTDITLQYTSRLGDTSDGGVFFGQEAGSGGYRAVAIGSEAGQTSQSAFAVAVGLHAGQTSQGTAGVAIGHVAGQTSQGQDAVAVGVGAGINSQGQNAVAIGERAGAGYTTPQGEYAVAIGAHAGYNSQVAYSIAINASGNDLNPTEAGLYIDPIRNDVAGGNVTAYNTSTKELVNTNVSIGNNGITLANGTNITDGESGLFVDSLNAAETGNVVFYNVDTKEVTYGVIADLRPDAISNNSHIWSVDGTSGALFSDAGTYISDSANSVVIGQNIDLTNTNTNRVSIGNSSGQTNQGYGSVAVGEGAGNLNQSPWSVAVGLNAGNNNQSNSATAVGHGAGYNYQGSDAVAVGVMAGKNNQGNWATAVGNRAGTDYQQNYAVSIGNYAGETYQDTYAVAIGNNAGNYYQGSGSVAIGDYAGENGLSPDGIAIGTYAQQNGNGWAPIAIGRYAGQNTQGSQAIAFGNYAGNDTQGYHAVAIGHYAGHHAQGQHAIAIGDYAGQDSQGQGAVAVGSAYAGYQGGEYSVALGYGAGNFDGIAPLGAYDIAIGANAGNNGGPGNSIVIDATNSGLSASASGLYISPIRYEATQDATNDGLMFYNQSTKEVRYSYTLDGGSF